MSLVLLNPEFHPIDDACSAELLSLPMLVHEKDAGEGKSS